MLKVTAAAITSSQNRTFNGPVATFTVSGGTVSSGELSATIVWGDGSASTPGVVGAASGGGFSVSGTHKFRNKGSFPVAVLITGPQGEEAFSLGVASVRRKGVQVKQKAVEAVVPGHVVNHHHFDMALNTLEAMARPRHRA
jgi:hypothetical protein